jgi:hypothetical protein
MRSPIWIIITADNQGLITLKIEDVNKEWGKY